MLCENETKEDFGNNRNDIKSQDRHTLKYALYKCIEKELYELSFLTKFNAASAELIKQKSKLHME